jgi:hypothetical protein
MKICHLIQILLRGSHADMILDTEIGHESRLIALQLT